MRSAQLQVVSGLACASLELAPTTTKWAASAATVTAVAVMQNEHLSFMILTWTAL